MNKIYPYMDVLIRFIIGAIFIWASYDKIIDPGKFAREISNYHVVPFGLENIIAITLPWIELFIGVPLHLVLSVMSHLKAKRTYDEAARYFRQTS